MAKGRGGGWRPRIAGLETEYGCLTASAGQAARVVPRVRDWVFANDRFGLLDRHDRGWDEPAGNGGFLYNGGRLYVDMGHVEYCTAECASLEDLLRRDRAGDLMILAALREMDLSSSVQFIRNNIDHHSGATFGCHENYSLLRHAPLTDDNLLSLLVFLTLRTLFTGTGRVGGGVPFQISQRADYIENEFFEWVQHSRAIINTRDEPLADPRRYRRLHLLHGDTHVLPSALYLKVGATRLVLDLLEVDALPKAALREAVATLRQLSHQPEPPWRVTLLTGAEADAVEMLSLYRQACAEHFARRDPETDAVLALWKRVEEGLAGNLSDLIGLVDWVTKRHALETFRQSERLAWNDPWLESQDLEYHQVDPERSLGLALANLDGPWGVDLNEPAALLQPPAGTRAVRRSELMRRLVAAGGRGVVDWHYVVEDGKEPVALLDPYQTS